MKILKKSDALILFNFQENWRVWFNVLQFLWPRVHEISQKSDALIFLNLHDPGGTWKSTKIRRFNFHKKSDALILIMIFVDFHESWRKSMCLIFVNFHVLGHENWRKLKRLIFVNFHVPGIMKIEDNRSVRFLLIFMYPGSWKSSKIRQFNFLQFSWPSTWKSTKIIIKIKASDFFWKLNRLIFVDFHIPPGSWKLRKIKASDFCEMSCTPWGQVAKWWIHLACGWSRLM